LTHFEIWPRGAASGGYRLPAPYMGQSPAKTTSEKFRRILMELFGTSFSEEHQINSILRVSKKKFNVL